MYLVTVKKGNLQLIEKDSTGKNYVWNKEEASSLLKDSNNPIVRGYLAAA